MDDLLNTSSVLAFSEQQEALIAAQQQVTQRVMDNNQLLRETLRKEQERAERYKQLYEAELAKTQQLEDRVAQLEARPTIYADQLVGVQNIEQQNVRNQLVTGNTRKRNFKNKYLDLTNQLNIWPNSTTSL